MECHLIRNLSELPQTFCSIFIVIQELRCTDALAELYANLNEEDMFHGLWKMSASLPETKRAVCWAQHGCMDFAQECLTNASEKASSRAGEGKTPSNPLQNILKYVQQYKLRLH